MYPLEALSALGVMWCVLMGTISPCVVAAGLMAWDAEEQASLGTISPCVVGSGLRVTAGLICPLGSWSALDVVRGVLMARAAEEQAGLGATSPFVVDVGFPLGVQNGVLAPPR